MFSALKYRDQDVKEVKPSSSHSKSHLIPNDNIIIQFDAPSVENIPGQNSVMTSKGKRIRTVDNNIMHSQLLRKILTDIYLQALMGNWIATKE